MHTFLEEFKERKVRRVLAIYTSAALPIIGMANIFATRYQLNPALFDTLAILIAVGLPAAVVAAWYHGQEGKQPIKKREVSLYGILTIVAGVFLLRAWTAYPRISVPVGEKSIAVLPFKNISESREDEYFSDGMTEDILTQLSKIGDLRVISRTTIMKYKNSQKTLREIGEELGVASILEGSVRRAGNRIRIVGQLINARTDEHIWAETYDRAMEDVFAIQTEVAKSIANALQAVLLPREVRQIEKKSTSNLEAYGLYLRGRDYLYRFTAESNTRAIDLFSKALELDSAYALAFAGLADAYIFRSQHEIDQTLADSALVFAKRAVDLDPTLSEGYKALGNTFERKGQRREALENYKRAVDLNPNYAPAVSNIGFMYYLSGQYDEALGWMKKAMAIEPGTARWSSNVGLQYYYLGFDSLAQIWLHRALNLQPEFVFPYIVLTYIDMHAGRYDSARARMAQVMKTFDEASIAFDAGGDVELLSGNFANAQELYKKAVTLSSYRSEAGIKLAFVWFKMNNTRGAKEILAKNLTPDAADPSAHAQAASAYFTAGAFVVAGRHPEALRLLNRSYDLGFRDRRWLAADPLMDPLRSDQGFVRFATKVDAAIEKMRARVMRRESAM